MLVVESLIQPPQRQIRSLRAPRGRAANAYGRVIALACALTVLLCAAGVAAQSKPARVPDTSLQESIEQALLDTSDTLARNLHVSVTGGIVTISGRVSSDFVRGTSYPPAVVKQNVGAIVRAIPGVTGIKLTFDADPPQPLNNGNTSGRGGRGRI